MDTVELGGEFEGPVLTLIILIIGIRIAARNSEHACPQTVSYYMGDRRRVPIIKADSGQLVYQVAVPVGID
jgi:hypothetical protein